MQTNMRATVTRLFLFTLCCSVARARLSIGQVREEVEKRGINHYSVANPLFGWLFGAIGCLQNLRFFSPSLVPRFENGRREFAKDDSPDPFVKSLVRLFPSPAGTLCHATTHAENFAHNLGKVRGKILGLKAEIKLKVGAELSYQMDGLKKKMNELCRNEKLKEETEELRKKVGELEVSAKLKDKLDELKEGVDGLKMGAELDRKMDKLKKNVGALNDDAEFKREMRKLNAKIGELKSKIRSTKWESRDKMAELKRRIEELGTSTDLGAGRDLKDKIGELTKKMDELKGRIEEPKEVVEFLAKLFVFVAGKKEPRPCFGEGETKRSKELESLIEKSCRPLEEMLLQDANGTYASVEESLKPFLIHAFVINLLDDPEDLGIYLKAISDGIGSDKSGNHGLGDIFEIVTGVYLGLNFFPYSKLVPPPSNVQIPIYNRTEDRFLDDKPKFSDCVDVMLLNLCNCLFYDNERFEYSVEHLRELSEDAPLRIFYKKYPKPFTITEEIRKDWSRVIQDLPDFEEEDSSECKTHKILYHSEGRNEVHPGTINMMNVLAKISRVKTGLSGDPEGELGKKLADFLGELRVKIPGSSIEVKAPSFTEFWPADKSSGSKRKDYAGNVQVKLDYREGKDNAVVLIEQTSGHSELKFVSSWCAAKDTLKLPQRLLTMSEAGLPISVIFLKRFVHLARGEEVPCGDGDQPYLFDTIFTSGPLSSNSDKCTTLNKIYGALGTKGEHDCSLKHICELLVGSVNLEDPATKRQFSPFFAHVADLEDDLKVRDHWKNAIIANYKDTFEFWDKRLVKEGMLDLNFEGDHVWEDNAKLVAKSLKGMTNLTTLNLSGSNIGDAGAGAIASELANAPSLATLNLSRCSIGAAGAGEIAGRLADLSKLTTLNLSENNIWIEGAEAIASNLAEASSLTTLNLSKANLQTEGATAIAKKVAGASKLANLNLSANEIDRGGAVVIAERLANASNLRVLNLSGNKVGGPEAKSNIRKKLPHLSSLLV